jgi:hypothetical protein
MIILNIKLNLQKLNHALGANLTPVIMKKLFILFSLFFASSLTVSGSYSRYINNSDTYLRIAEKLVLATKNKTKTAILIKSLAEADEDILANELFNDTRKKAFWINIYNAFVQIILTDSPELFDNRGDFYSAKQIIIANQKLSLDDIEHGIIRGSKIKLSLGLIKNPFAGSFEKKFRVETVDGRIHFALNCGAISCPYVGIYDYTILNEQLDKSSNIYLTKGTRVDGETIYVSSLFSWFRGDFGNQKDIINFLKKQGVLKSDKHPKKMEYNDYDWTLELGNFIEL